MNKQFLATTLAFVAASSAYGQDCNLFQDTFAGFGNGTPITSVPGWFASTGTPAPDISAASFTGTSALNMRSQTASSASRVVPASSTGVYSLNFEVGTDDIITTSQLFCAGGAVLSSWTSTTF